MRFLADMGISPDTVAFLSSLGHDAVHVADLNLAKHPDSQVLDNARADRRVLLTHDLDFGELLAAGGSLLPSVVVFRLRNMHPDSAKVPGRTLASDLGKEEAGQVG